MRHTDVTPADDRSCFTESQLLNTWVQKSNSVNGDFFSFTSQGFSNRITWTSHTMIHNEETNFPLKLSRCSVPPQLHAAFTVCMPFPLTCYTHIFLPLSSVHEKLSNEEWVAHFHKLINPRASETNCSVWVMWFHICYCSPGHSSQHRAGSGGLCHT